MTDEKVKAPNPAVVDRALAKEAAGEELRANEEKALAAQAAIDAERGYERIDFRGVTMYRCLRTHHTEEDEARMQRYVANLHPVGTIPVYG